MTALPPSSLHLEWATLQHEHEGHERTALLVKLSAVLLTAQMAFFGLPLQITAPLIGVLWVVEAVARTVQARLGARIERIEHLIARDADASSACQLHTEWQAGRTGLVGLLREYASAAVRPTVAFPYPLLLILLLVLSFRG